MGILSSVDVRCAIAAKPAVTVAKGFVWRLTSPFLDVGNICPSSGSRRIYLYFEVISLILCSILLTEFVELRRKSVAGCGSAIECHGVILPPFAGCICSNRRMWPCASGINVYNSCSRLTTQFPQESARV